MSDRLADIKAREQAAFGGPWEVLDADENGMHAVAVDGTVLVEVGDFCDAEFIAHARDDIPHLLALVESLTADRDALRITASLAGLAAEERDMWRGRAERARAVVARVESLAGQWEREAEDLLRNCYSGRDVFEAERTVQIVSELRAALADSEADTGEQEAGHRCEPYYSRSQCGQCGWQEQWCATCSRQMCGCATKTTNQEDQA